ncbi:hypothetical protein KL911_002719 [Ogataea haglerorum]|uniref:uncharacterized protein n=1 Tax=Ogataea haglerorum TaxID=1937702 RepID=UPI001C8A7488|nr:uncharacterized protein KL911_002719 [Ogataea haglerorum]KAG7747599.1 hypothetical protein KL912_002971 [Ogataea haglerorum]KAG7753326.1 hypothetical protein KL911_002719 [Ogataea haglerorum]
MADVSGMFSAPLTNENYELWIRMATDNVPSTTLDGCVKIYASRIDSAASETGKLLSGLTSNNLEGIDEEEDENNEQEGGTTKPKSKKHRAESTLAKKFQTIKLKEVEKELFVDPIFKKALSDFDEGGAKSLLTNMLKINTEGRVVFDTSEKSNELIMNKSDHEEDVPQHIRSNINISKLARFFPDTTAETKVCPSLEQLERITKEGASAAELLEQIGQLEFPEEQPVFQEDDNLDFGGGDFLDNDDDDDDDDGNGPERSHRNQYSLFIDGVNDSDRSGPNVTLTRLFDENPTPQFDDDGDEEGGRSMAEYFDTISRQNWRGPEHWKIAMVKQAHQKSSSPEIPPAQAENVAGDDGKEDFVQKVTSKRKAVFTLNFMNDDDDLDDKELFAAPANASRLLIPEKDRIPHPTANKLPEDLQFTTKRLICLNIKPTQKINTILTRKKKRVAQRLGYDDERIADENFFADTYKEQGDGSNAEGQGFDDTFFNADYNDHPDDDDDDEGDIPDLPTSSQPLFSQSQKRPGALGYARVAKKVNVKLLKDNLWDSLEAETRKAKRDSSVLEDNKENGPPEEDNSTQRSEKDENTLRFTKVVSKLSSKYSPEEKSELSTSFCFICLLHLANENNFTIENTPDYTDLLIKR